MNIHWRKLIAIAVLSWSVLDMAAASIDAMPSSAIGASHTVVSSTNSAPPADSEGYCDGDCIFCSSAIRPAEHVHLTVETRVARLEVVTVAGTYEDFTNPIDHPPQN